MQLQKIERGDVRLERPTCLSYESTGCNCYSMFGRLVLRISSPYIISSGS